MFDLKEHPESPLFQPLNPDSEFLLETLDRRGKNGFASVTTSNNAEFRTDCGGCQLSAQGTHQANMLGLHSSSPVHHIGPEDARLRLASK